MRATEPSAPSLSARRTSSIQLCSYSRNPPRNAYVPCTYKETIGNVRKSLKRRQRIALFPIPNLLVDLIMKARLQFAFGSGDTVDEQMLEPQAVTWNTCFSRGSRLTFGSRYKNATSYCKSLLSCILKTVISYWLVALSLLHYRMPALQVFLVPDSPSLISCGAIFIPLCLVLTILRFYTRHVHGIKLGIDDWLVIPACVSKPWKSECCHC